MGGETLLHLQRGYLVTFYRISNKRISVYIFRTGTYKSMYTKTSMKNDILKVLAESNQIVSKRVLATRIVVDHITILQHLSGIGKVTKWIPNELNKLDPLNLGSSLLT